MSLREGKLSTPAMHTYLNTLVAIAAPELYHSYQASSVCSWISAPYTTAISNLKEKGWRVKPGISNLLQRLGPAGGMKSMPSQILSQSCYLPHYVDNRHSLYDHEKSWEADNRILMKAMCCIPSAGRARGGQGDVINASLFVSKPTIHYPSIARSKIAH